MEILSELKGKTIERIEQGKALEIQFTDNSRIIITAVNQLKRDETGVFDIETSLRIIIPGGRENAELS